MFLSEEHFRFEAKCIPTTKEEGLMSQQKTELFC